MESMNLVGYYFTKSPYHNETFYLPFIVEYYDDSTHSYMVRSVEYKGWNRYQSDAYYSEEVLQRYIDEGTIQKVDRNENKKLQRLVSLYMNAKEPLV